MSEAEFEIREGLAGLTPARIATLYRRAPLLQRPAAPEDTWAMFEASSLVLTAWVAGDLAGIARVLSDGRAFSYLCDLAVEPDRQGLGIGRGLVEEVLRRCEGTDIMVRDIDAVSTMYARFGFRRVSDAWERRRGE